jgi:hypothetical protein
METSNQINPRLGFKLAFLLSILTVILLGIYFVNVGYLAGNTEEETNLTADAEPSEPEEITAIGPNCRYGIAPASNNHITWLDDFGVGWYLTFGSTARPAENFAEFVPIIRTRQDRDANFKRLPSYTVDPDFPQLKINIEKRPGALWVVGNEVDRWKLQDDIMPDLYAEAYHEVYNFIKNTDPTAQVAISALVEVTPGRLQYLDIVWNSYLKKYRTTMPVDVWNMHLYTLPERKWGTDDVSTFAFIANGTDPNLAKFDSGLARDPKLCPRDDVYCLAEHDDMDIFAEQVTSMRKWMKDHGQQNKPLIISEYSILYPYKDEGGGNCSIRDEEGNCFSPSRVIKFMDSSFNYLENTKDPNLGYPLDENRLVQQWLWYSTWVDPESDFGGNSSNLLETGLGPMSAIGKNFHDEVGAKPLTTNLFPVNPVGGSASTNSNSTVDVILSVGVMNNGNHVTADNIQVTFYSDEGLNKEIGTAVIPKPSNFYAGMVGCARKTIRVETLWENLSQGIHQYWVRVDGDDSIPESDENDNVASGFVWVDPQHQTYLPNSHK